MKHLITPADITAQTVISITAEAHKLALAIPIAQGRHLRPLLGLQLFDELLSFAESAPELPAARDAASMTAYEAARQAWRSAAATDPLLTLLDEVTPMLCAWALIEAWPSLIGHITPAGIVLKTGKSEGTTSADAGLMREMFAGLRELAVFRGEELDAWLRRNRQLYSRFLPSTPAATGAGLIGGCFFG
ncbi:hypothetical protein Q5H92_21895 [Hymenobacter sp. M29]|uniref:Uncharacterized protein n=1 Tax=Hymenobacter mellowenesis TaxID=3063995 RepID=A0ABT9AHJ3_9BACT|nr:hypothetical protein [Hymenobacter sp. M29]MDO7849033.1 hypothetical protein [Hymenobacter sp. M29]